MSATCCNLDAHLSDLLELQHKFYRRSNYNHNDHTGKHLRQFPKMAFLLLYVTTLLARKLPRGDSWSLFHRLKALLSHFILNNFIFFYIVLFGFMIMQWNVTIDNCWTGSKSILALLYSCYSCSKWHRECKIAEAFLCDSLAIHCIVSFYANIHSLLFFKRMLITQPQNIHYILAWLEVTRSVECVLFIRK